MPHLLNNTVIKNLSPEMRKEIVQLYKDDGWDVGDYVGGNVHPNECIYYGSVNGSFFSSNINCRKQSGGLSFFKFLAYSLQSFYVAPLSCIN